MSENLANPVTSRMQINVSTNDFVPRRREKVERKLDLTPVWAMIQKHTSGKIELQKQGKLGCRYKFRHAGNGK
jgi:hypothetical protein